MLYSVNQHLYLQRVHIAFQYLVLWQASYDLATYGGSGEWSCWGTAPDPSQGAGRPLHPHLHMTLDKALALAQDP